MRRKNHPSVRWIVWIVLFYNVINENQNDEIHHQTWFVNAFKSTSRGRYFAVEKVFPPLNLIGTNINNNNNNRERRNRNIKLNLNMTTDSIPSHSSSSSYSSSSSSSVWTVGSSGSSSLYSTTNNNDHRDPLNVLYTNHPKMVEKWLADHLPTTGICCLGFDTESVPRGPSWIKGNFQGPATIQLSTPESCLVVHMVPGHNDDDHYYHHHKCGGGNHYCDTSSRKACLPILDAILCDETIIKAGCSIDEDIIQLNRFFFNNNQNKKNHNYRFLSAQSRLDIGTLVVLEQEEAEEEEQQQYLLRHNLPEHERKSLKSLTNIVLGMELRKPKRIVLSDWSHVPLSPAQLAYSARDAWASAAIVQQLTNHDPNRFALDQLQQELQNQLSIPQLLHQRRLRHRNRNRNRNRKRRQRQDKHY